MDTGLSDRIKQFRAALGMSQTEFARAIGSITGIRADPPRQATISAWEDAEGSDPERGTLRLIADLAEPSYAVFEWLQYGGEMPVFHRLRPADRLASGGTGKEALAALATVYGLATEAIVGQSRYAQMNQAVPWAEAHAVYLRIAAHAGEALRQAGGSPGLPNDRGVGNGEGPH